MPAGTFMMGSPPDEPYRGRYTEELREVTLTHDILYDQFETTQEEWQRSGAPNLAGTKATGDGSTDCLAEACPASTMTWYEAANYANWRSRKEGFKECFSLVSCRGTIGNDFDCIDAVSTTRSYYECEGYRLPTMAEFQYAARAGTSTAFYSGPLEARSADGCAEIDHLSTIAWYCANAHKITHAVGTMVPNAFGLHDMLGNAFELTGSQPYAMTDSTPLTDPGARLEESEEFGFVGGGAWSLPYTMRVASQAGSLQKKPSSRQVASATGLGFRLVRSISREEAERWKR